MGRSEGALSLLAEEETEGFFDRLDAYELDASGRFTQPVEIALGEDQRTEAYALSL